MRTVNIPLLRKAVEWAEAEAMKPPELCEWNQAQWISPKDYAEAVAWGFGWLSPEYFREARALKSPECGTCYCIAGFVVSEVGGPGEDGVSGTAADALGLNDQERWELFSASNTIEDVRRVAEDIAGERL